jgi:hypothetical protein
MPESYRAARLSGTNGEWVTFAVVGYQFPDYAPQDDHDYDANWLNVLFRVSDGDRTWGTRAAAWLTWDLPRLATWLRGVANGEQPEYQWTALEPLLSLECVEASPSPRINVHLALELRSDDVKMSHEPEEMIELAPSALEVLNAAEAAGASYARFPPR